MPDIKFQSRTSGLALTRTKKPIQSTQFPFTLNANIGCLYKCSYCYLQSPPFSFQTDFGNEVRIKTDLPQKLDEELFKHSQLPAYIKRVQINEATEGYLPQTIQAASEHLGRDLMREILQTFRKHWRLGNRWMLHLVTKSHLILNHVDLIEEMRDQLQIELTLTTLDETLARKVEGDAPSVSKRLEVLDQFAKRNVFVRIMCMPFLGNVKEAATIKGTLLNRGAKAFKQKGLNYFDRELLLKGKTARVKGRLDEKFQDLIYKSGEVVLDDGGAPESQILLLPNEKWDSFTEQSIQRIDSGYKEMNSYDWGYVN
jgi:DNA repair photolyase